MPPDAEAPDAAPLAWDALLSGLRVLALSPHTDDVELGAGGTVARLVGAGARVRVVALSDAAESNPGFDLRAEFTESMDQLGVTEHAVLPAAIPVRHFPEHRQRVLDALLDERNCWHPQIVLCPCSTDAHQDHGVVYAEALRAFRLVTIFGYVLPWNTPRTVPLGLTVELTNQHVGRKIAALSAYRSQEGRSYIDPLLIEGQARADGARNGFALGESYEVIRVALPLG